MTKENRTFLFTIELSSEGWNFLKNFDGDRTEAGADIIKQLGGEVFSYHYGLGNGKVYAMLSLPNKEVTQAIAVTRLLSGTVKSFEVVELLSGADMLNVYKKMDDVAAIDDVE